MQGTYLKFYVHENRRHHHVLLYEWLLEEAKRLGVQGGSAFRAIAGYGRHGIIHEQHFYELAGDLTVEVGFLVSESDAERLLERVKQEKIQILYVRIPADFGVIDGA